MKYHASPSRQQLGGTLTGLVVGLLVGLGIALAVAVYVTRVPVPFVDRGVSRKPAQDAEEAERNKGWNPNAGLAGQQSPPQPLPATEAAGAIAVPGAAVAPREEDAPESDPLGDLVRSRLGDSPTAPSSAPAPATPAAPSSAVPTDGAVYFVQAGAFRSPEDAQAQRARLAMIGMSADVTEREQSGRTVFRVRVGPFNQKPLAEATREQLEINGVEAALVRIQR